MVQGKALNIYSKKFLHAHIWRHSWLLLTSPESFFHKLTLKSEVVSIDSELSGRERVKFCQSQSQQSHQQISV